MIWLNISILHDQNNCTYYFPLKLHIPNNIFLICKPMIAQNIAHTLSHTHDKTKNIFLYFFTKLKTCHLSYSIYKHDTINIADPCSMQDACQIWTS